MNLLATLTTLEENEDLHLARILILLYAFAGENGHGRVLAQSSRVPFHQS